jgi:RimJ/RimL family protein N-acetyltransferase
MFTTLRTARLELRTLQRADAAAMFAYRSAPEVARYQSWEPATEAELRSFIESLALQEEPTPGQWFQVGIALREPERLIGDIGVHVSAADPRQAEVGISLAPAHQGQGLATEALGALLDYLFSTLRLHRVSGSVDPRNGPSMALLKRIGMRQEAHFVESCWCKGEWTDDVICALLKREWDGIQAAGAR